MKVDGDQHFEECWFADFGNARYYGFKSLEILKVFSCRVELRILPSPSFAVISLGCNLVSLSMIQHFDDSYVIDIHYYHFWEYLWDRGIKGCHSRRSFVSLKTWKGAETWVCEPLGYDFQTPWRFLVEHYDKRFCQSVDRQLERSPSLSKVNHIPRCSF